MSAPRSWIGERFGRLVVKSRTPDKDRLSCICDCGKNTVVNRWNLSGGRTRSCGCLRSEVSKIQGRLQLLTHGQSYSKTYTSWKMMRSRCDCPKDISYPNYGGRGIKYVSRWGKFEKFLEDMGARPDGTTLDRININKNYSKSNCRWATRTTQQRNKRDSLPWYLYKKIDRIMLEENVSYAVAYRRVTKGMIK